MSMNMDLDFITFKANMRDYSSNSNDLLVNILSNVSTEYWIAYVFYYAFFDKTKTEKGIAYYCNLVDQVAKLSTDYTYDESEVQLYKEFVKIYYNVDNHDFDIAKTKELIEVEFTTTPDKYTQYMLRYNLLLWYSNVIYTEPSYLSEMRELIKYLNEHKNEYDELSSAVTKEVRG